MNFRSELLIAVIAIFIVAVAWKLSSSEAEPAQLKPTASTVGANKPSPAPQTTAKLLLPSTIGPVALTTPASSTPGNDFSPKAPDKIVTDELGFQFGPEPLNGSKMALVAIQLLLKSKQPNLPTVSSPASVEIKGPLRIYDLPVVAIENGGGLGDAQSANYLYYAEDAGKPFASIVVLSDASGAAVKVIDTSYGRNGAAQIALKAALQHLSYDSQLDLRSYEVRLLRQKSSGFAAVWLKSANDGADLIYSYEVNPNYNILNIKPDTLISTDDFINTVRAYYLERQSRLQGSTGRGD